jgi:hypothetical protein
MNPIPKIGHLIVSEDHSIIVPPDLTSEEILGCITTADLEVVTDCILNRNRKSVRLIDLDDVVLEGLFCGREICVDGDTHYRRAIFGKDNPGLILGLREAYAMQQDQAKIPDEWALMPLQFEPRINFYGTILCSGNGEMLAPCLILDGLFWKIDFVPLRSIRDLRDLVPFLKS